MSSTTDARFGPEHGSALIVALWLSLILALLAIGMLSVSRSLLAEARMETRLQRSWYAAEAGIAIATEQITEERGGWRPRAAPYQREFEGIPLTIHVVSARSRADLNGADAPFLAYLFQELGAGSDRAAALGDAVADWRDGDNFPRPNGAEAPEYDIAGLPEPRNSEFQNVGELSEVMGFTEAAAECVAPFVTVYSGAREMDPRGASDPIRRALALRARDGEVAAEAADPNAVFGEAFEITATAPVSDRMDAQVYAVVRPTGVRENPLLVHAWERTLVRRDAESDPVDDCF